MKLTQKKVKELKENVINEREAMYLDFVKACCHFPKDRSTKTIIAKYNYLGGQLNAYQKILQIMQLKVK